MLDYLAPRLERYIRGETREDIKRMGRYGIREVRDNGNAVPSIGCFIRGCINRQEGVRKSRGSVTAGSG
jgi:hypothetical protein